MKKILMIGTVVMLLAGQAFAEEEGFWAKMAKGNNGGANSGGGAVGAAIVIGTLGIRGIAYALSDKEKLAANNKEIEAQQEETNKLSKDFNAAFYDFSKAEDQVLAETDPDKKIVLTAKMTELQNIYIAKRTLVAESQDKIDKLKSK
jgi:hypothetical protein